MKKSHKILKSQKISFFNSCNKQVFILFGLIIIVSLFFDFYFKNSNLIIPFLATTLISSVTTFLGIPILKKIKLKQIIREEGPKNHFIKQGTPTMGGIFFIPIGIIISNILYFNNQDFKMILTLSLLILSFMLIGLIDDLISLKKKI